MIDVDATIVGKVVDFFIPENCAGALQPLDATPHTVFASTGAAAAMSARKMNAVEARAMARAVL